VDRCRWDGDRLDQHFGRIFLAHDAARALQYREFLGKASAGGSENKHLHAAAIYQARHHGRIVLPGKRGVDKHDVRRSKLSLL